jgi:hypothetical protein
MLYGCPEMRALLLISVLAATGCATTLIPGTNIYDTDDNRAVLTVLEELRVAMQDRSVDNVVRLVSTRYFEDMGTPTQEDDYGYEQLKTDVLPKSLAVTKEMYVQFEVHEITVEGDLARCDVRYKSRARIDLPAGTKWDSHREFNRVELMKEEGAWKITSGL